MASEALPLKSHRVPDVQQAGGASPVVARLPPSRAEGKFAASGRTTAPCLHRAGGALKAYCINLDRRADRLDFMTAEFARHGVPFTRMPAVDGQDPAVAEAASRSKPSVVGIPISANAYACFQSHRTIWRMLLDSGEAYAMIFEDDLLLAEGVAQYLKEDWIPADADVVRLETSGIRVHLQAGAGLAAGPRRVFRMLSYHTGTGCYLISAAAAARLLAATTTINDPIDHAMFNQTSPLFRMLVTYQMLPAPVIQGDRAAAAPPQGAAWAASSITDRFAGEHAKRVLGRETPLARLRRRLGAEVWSCLHGARYRYIAYG